MEPLANLYAAHALWVWMALAALLLAVEILTGSGWLLWASASAVAVGVAAGLLGLSAAGAVLLYAALTIASTLLARRYLPRSVTAGEGDINDNVARLVGHRGAAAGAFVRGAGRVFIDGKEWAAELDGDEVLESGAPVEITGVHGARLTVRAV